MPALTVGMATYDDFDGVWFTIQALRLYQDLTDVELLVVDNFGCETTRDFLESWTPARYLRSTDVQGTAAPRDLVFREATGDAVLCCDPHVLFAPGVIARLKRHYEENPTTRDLLQGPLVSDDLAALSTHFSPEWRGQMWGTWDTDPRGADPEGEPFDIPMQGLGAFSCRRDAWLGFNERFRGFGGEEGYIHEKFRQAGHRTLCAPWFRWNHRFGRPKGTTYRNTYDDRLRNYLIGHAELGLDVVPIVEHFSQVLSDDAIQKVVTEALWPEAVEPVEPVESVESVGAPDAVGAGQPVEGTHALDSAYRAAASAPSDIHEHVPALRALAEQCVSVTEFGTRGGVSTTALARGGPRVLTTYDVVHDPAVDRLATVAEGAGVDLRVVVADVLEADIEETDLLFIDTLHTADQLHAELTRHADRVRKWIALHDTCTFGPVGEDGGPGLLVGLDRFLGEWPGWTRVHHTDRNNGFTILARDADRVPLPSFFDPDEGATPGETAGPSGASMERGAGEGSDLPFLVALCPTYKRRRPLENAIACFLEQTYPPTRRRLLVLDDSGDVGNVDEDTWAVVSTSERYPSLPAKYAALVALARERWPQVDAFVIWEDDDTYLPAHLSAHAHALGAPDGTPGASWSKPSMILSTASGSAQPEASAGRFFASMAFRGDLFDAAGGFVDTRRGDFDQQFLARLERFAGPPADPVLHERPTYVFRWGNSGAPHGQLFMRGPDDETWWDRAGEAAPPVKPDRPLAPELDEETRELMERLSAGVPRAADDGPNSYRTPPPQGRPLLA